MARDLFEEYGIDTGDLMRPTNAPRDLFQEAGIQFQQPPAEHPQDPSYAQVWKEGGLLPVIGKGMANIGGAGFYNPLMQAFYGATQPIAPEWSKQGMGRWNKGYEQAGREAPIATGVGEFAGNVAPYFMLPEAKLAQGLGVLGRTALSAGTMGLMEAEKYGTPEERLERGVTGAIAGSLGANLIPVGKNLYKAFPMTEKGLAKRAGEILAKSEEAENIASKMYKEPTQAATKAGITLGNPKKFIHQKDIEFINSQISPNRARAFKTYLENPDLSFEDAHKFYKFLGDTSRKLSSNRNIDKNVLETIGELQNTVTKKMDSSLIRGGLKKEAGKIKEANKFYQKNVLPYRNPIIEAYKQGKTRPKAFLDELSKLSKWKKESKLAEEFLTKKGHEHPWLKYREYKKPIGISLGVGGVGLLGGHAYSPFRKFLWGGHDESTPNYHE
jgi:hypothetical protein